MARWRFSGRGRWCSKVGVRAGLGAHRRRRGRRDVGGPVLARLVVAQRGGVVAGVAVDRLAGVERVDARQRVGAARGRRPRIGRRRVLGEPVGWAAGLEPVRIAVVVLVVVAVQDAVAVGVRVDEARLGEAAGGGGGRGFLWALLAGGLCGAPGDGDRPPGLLGGGPGVAVAVLGAVP